jgi:ribosomal protein L23
VVRSRREIWFAITAMQMIFNVAVNDVDSANAKSSIKKMSEM